ncbi:MAG: endonuclease III [Deltaproteobacteria bacterium GWC2_42_11]|nr:MAG: endonuclease III [Deltaproteobacteria bacterium GWC2_42_11]HBO84561.1 endonuclease III [Deltaproteobacteria bacterium]
MDKTEKAKKIVGILIKEYPNPKIALNFKTPLQLLVATILSAQCTDERVNKVIPELFKRFKTAEDFTDSDLKELEESIRSINFYKNKAKSIKECCKVIVQDFNGRLPDTVEELITLPGVGRKTANIVLGSAFGKDAIAVDTHVKRVSNRIGLAESDNPDKIERELLRIIPRNKWTLSTNLLILHGRNICGAKQPLCEICKVKKYCDFFNISLNEKT